MKHLKSISIFLLESADYRGQHEAPSNDGFSSPMYDLENMFPGIYNKKALQYYGVYNMDDASVIQQIQSVHNKPNKLIKIYRAVPNLNKDIDKQIKELGDIIKYKDRYSFYPKKDIITDIKDEILKENPTLSYNEIEKEIENKIYDKIEELTSKKEKPLKINDGDWVTTSKLYAKEHGMAHLRNEYKILSKTVKVSQLYNNGDSIFEFGYVE